MKPPAGHEEDGRVIALRPGDRVHFDDDPEDTGTVIWTEANLAVRWDSDGVEDDLNDDGTFMWPEVFPGHVVLLPQTPKETP